MSAIVVANPLGWQQAADAVRSGQVVAFPTDTVYGVGCSPTDVAAIRAIYELKGRSARKALPLLLAGKEQLERVAVALPSIADTLGAHFWPGALTIVLRRRGELPIELSGDDTIAVRVPDHSQLRDFIASCGGFIAATSANLSGRPEALTAGEVTSYFASGLALVVDGGPVSGGVPSIVIDCSTETPLILRQGAIRKEAIESALQMPVRGADVQD